MKKDPEVFLEHILESIELIESYTAHKSITDFIKHRFSSSVYVS